MFGTDGPSLSLLSGAPALDLRLASISNGRQSLSPAVRSIQVDPNQANRLVYRREHAVQEWYVNRARGVEQGFTLQQPLFGAKDDQLYIDLAVNQAWKVTVQAGNIYFKQGASQLRYSGLKAWDAEGSRAGAAKCSWGQINTSGWRLTSEMRAIR